MTTKIYVKNVLMLIVQVALMIQQNVVINNSKIKYNYYSFLFSCFNLQNTNITLY